MVDQTIRDLVQSEVDGTNSPTESARVQALVREDAEVARLYNDLKAIAGVLSRSAAAPPTLKPSVMRAVEQMPVPRRHSILQQILNSIAHTPSPVEAVMSNRTKGTRKARTFQSSSRSASRSWTSVIARSLS